MLSAVDEDLELKIEHLAGPRAKRYFLPRGSCKLELTDNDNILWVLQSELDNIAHDIFVTLCVSELPKLLSIEFYYQNSNNLFGT